MMIRVGDQIPDTVFTVMGARGPEMRSSADVFLRRSVALFALPGAYTPVCHKEHLPGIVALCDEIKSKGIETIACTAVNDIYVLDRWSREMGADGKVLMLADGNAEFAIKAGLAVDLTRFGLGVRSMRYVMLVANGAVKLLNIDEVITSHDKSSAATLCSMVG